MELACVWAFTKTTKLGKYYIFTRNFTFNRVFGFCRESGSRISPYYDLKEAENHEMNLFQDRISFNKDCIICKYQLTSYDYRHITYVHHKPNLFFSNTLIKRRRGQLTFEKTQFLSNCRSINLRCMYDEVKTSGRG